MFSLTSKKVEEHILITAFSFKRLCVSNILNAEKFLNEVS